jgi:hypothetical protein
MTAKGDKGTIPVTSQPHATLAGQVAACDTACVDFAGFSPSEQTWLAQNEARWRRAHQIAERHPDLDAGDIYHVLCTLHETPTQRVRRSLAHGRFRPRTR